MFNLRIAMVGATCLVALLAGTIASAQAPQPDYLVRPGAGSQKSATGDYFVINAKRGATVRQSLEIKSESEVPLQLAVVPVDAMTGETGGVVYDRASDPADRVGSWIKVLQDRVRVGPGTTVEVPFTVRVPKTARKGVNIGALVVQDPAEIGSSGQVQDRTVIAVQIDTPGSKRPDLAITGVAVDPRPDGLYLEVGLSNNGTGFATGAGSIRIAEEVFESSIGFDTFVPGTAIAYPVRWTTDPKPGSYSAEVTVEYGNRNERIEWTGKIRVAPRDVADLAQLRGEGADDEGGGSGVLLIAGALFVVLSVGAALLFGRRGRQGPVTVLADDPDPSDEPSAAGGSTSAHPAEEELEI